MMEEPFTNRLIHEKSPYLLQHAHNPVDWYPWGEEAFTAAQENKKPIFLSIGYATCHWCHKMERECFSNASIANLMNDIFINVKVDREERPEIDALYMDFAQTMMVGDVGWPLNVVLTPTLKPFFAMTYLPPDNTTGLIGISQMLHRIREIWEGEERESVTMQAEKIIETFENHNLEVGEEMPDELHLENTAEILFKLADPLYGGIRGMPKFPVACQIFFMLRYVYHSSDGRALFYVDRTLDMMYRGGIYDHLGGGFSRYAVDETWEIPRFEKMLYDNALLARAYLDTWQVTKKKHFREVTEDIFAYVLESLQNPEGGFYCSEDADTEGMEGYYYTWTYDEIQEILGFGDAGLFCDFYGVTLDGNFNERNVLHSPLSTEEFSERRGLDQEEIELRLEAQREKLLSARKRRIVPLIDDKMLASWNGLMICSFALAAQLFGEERYLDGARKAAHFIKTHLWRDSALLRRWRDGESRYPGVLEDYAFMIYGLLTLFETDGDPGWLAWAMQMTGILEEKFKSENGAFYTNDGQDFSILIRRCDFADGAMPSANAVHCENLLRLYQFTSDERYRIQAEDILRAVKENLDSFTPSYCYHLVALSRYFDKKAPTIVVALNEEEQYKKEIKDVLVNCFIPNKAIIWRREDDEHLFELLPLVRNQPSIDKKTTVYICLKERCLLPMTELPEMIAAIKKI